MSTDYKVGFSFRMFLLLKCHDLELHLIWTAVFTSQSRRRILRTTFCVKSDLQPPTTKLSTALYCFKSDLHHSRLMTSSGFWFKHSLFYSEEKNWKQHTTRQCPLAFDPTGNQIHDLFLFWMKQTVLLGGALTNCYKSKWSGL